MNISVQFFGALACGVASANAAAPEFEREILPLPLQPLLHLP